MYVFVREWAQIHPSMEFRGFVYGKELNAISSYNRYDPPQVLTRLLILVEQCVGLVSLKEKRK